MAKKPPPITTRHPEKEWFAQQLANTGLSARAISLKMGANIHRWNRLINGEIKDGELVYQSMTVGDAIIISELLGQNFHEVLRRLGYQIPDTRLPIAGHFDADGRVHLRTQRIKGDDRSVPIPPDMTNTAHAIEAGKSSRIPPAFAGHVLIYEPRDMIEVGAFGHLSVINVPDEDMPVVGVLEHASSRRANINIFGMGVSRLENVEVASANPVRWQKIP